MAPILLTVFLAVGLALWLCTGKLVRRVLDCLEYIHYCILDSTDTNDILYPSDQLLRQMDELAEMEQQAAIERHQRQSCRVPVRGD